MDWPRTTTSSHSQLKLIQVLLVHDNGLQQVANLYLQHANIDSLWSSYWPICGH